MGRIWSLLLIFTLLLSCNNVPEPGISPQPGVEKKDRLPYNPNGQIILTKHARCRMDCRHITEQEIREILTNGEINQRKSNPDGRPDPKWAVEGYTKENQHLRIIVATEKDKLIIVTCIELGVEWTCDCN